MILTVNEDANQFKALSEFKSCMSRGGDVEFKWKGIDYTLSSVWPNGKMEFSIGPSNGVEKDSIVYDTVDELLEYKVDGDKLRDIITQAEINGFYINESFKKPISFKLYKSVKRDIIMASTQNHKINSYEWIVHS